MTMMMSDGILNEWGKKGENMLAVNHRHRSYNYPYFEHSLLRTFMSLIASGSFMLLSFEMKNNSTV